MLEHKASAMEAEMIGLRADVRHEMKSIHSEIAALARLLVIRCPVMVMCCGFSRRLSFFNRLHHRCREPAPLWSLLPTWLDHLTISFVLHRHLEPRRLPKAPSLVCFHRL